MPPSVQANGAHQRQGPRRLSHHFGVGRQAVAGPPPGGAGAPGLEGWFAAAGRPGRLDLARSGAPARSVGDLLALADAADARQYLEMSLDYGPGIGSERLRAAIAGFTGSSASDLVVTHGAAEALLLACGVAIGERRLIAVASPAYEGMFLAAQAMGATAQAIPVWKPGATRLDLARLVDLDLGRYAAVMVNSPHNPTGVTAEVPELEHLADLCSRAGTALIVDEVAIGTLDRRAVSLGTSRAGRCEAVMLIGDVSKAFGLGGLRVGWCATACPTRRQRLADLMQVSSLGNSAPSQHLAALALEQREHLGVFEMAQTNLGLLDAWMASMAGSTWVPPADGLVAFPSLPLPLPSLAFAERLRAERGVSVTPGAFFGHDRHLRIGLGLVEDDFAQGLVQLVEAMGVAPR